MTAYIRLREVAHLRLAFPEDHRFISDQAWLPLSRTELQLTAHHHAIAIRFHDGIPSIGIILKEQYLNRPLLNAAGQWQGTYKPISLRCFPLRIGESGSGPLQELEIPAESNFLAAEGGTPITEDQGRPSRTVTTIYQLLRLLRDGQSSMPATLDHLLIANLLVPLRRPDGEDGGPDQPAFYVVDAGRFAALGKRALAAMARHSFASVDVAVACLFSQKLIRPDCLPKYDQMDIPTATAPPPGEYARSAFGLDDLKLALDDSELFSFDDLETVKAPQAPPAAEPGAIVPVK